MNAAHMPHNNVTVYRSKHPHLATLSSVAVEGWTTDMRQRQHHQYCTAMVAAARDHQFGSLPVLRTRPVPVVCMHSNLRSPSLQIEQQHWRTCWRVIGLIVEDEEDRLLIPDLCLSDRNMIGAVAVWSAFTDKPLRDLHGSHVEQRCLNRPSRGLRLVCCVVFAARQVRYRTSQ